MLTTSVKSIDTKVSKSVKLTTARAVSILESIGDQYALSQARLLEEKGFSGLASLPGPHPSAYSSAYAFARDYGVYNLFRKMEVGDTKSLEDAAFAGFRANEERLVGINRYLDGAVGNDVEGILSYAKRKIVAILDPNNTGEFPYRDFALHCDWGPGATSTLTGGVESTLDNKITERRLGVTYRALKYARAYLEHAKTWAEARGIPCEGPLSYLGSEFNVHESGRLTTVPKDCKKRRTIDIQPTMNLFLQKGVGGVIRKRLKRHGINLDDQTRNQYLASISHKENLATIDLESASDSVSIGIVKALLPPTWFEVLNDLRTHSVDFQGEILPLSKFSAMGNGFTFELESLIFYALASAIVRSEADDCESPIAVYGDDIIIHQKHAERLIQVFETLGFRINLSKSFTSGRFFESCGKHYFDGYDVTPPYQKEELSTFESLIRCHNRLMRWGHRLCDGWALDVVVREPCHVLRGFCEQALEVTNLKRYKQHIRRQKGRKPRKFTPWTLLYQPFWAEGDSALLSLRDFDSDVNGRIAFEGFVFQPVKVQGKEYALYANALRKERVYDPSYGHVTPRGGGYTAKVPRVVYRGPDVVPMYADC